MRCYRLSPTILSLILLVTLLCVPGLLQARTGITEHAPLDVFIIDETPPQIGRPAINGLEDRRHGPIFNAAIQEVVRAGKLPSVTTINRDLSLTDTSDSQPKVAPGVPVLRIYLTQWSQTRLGGFADTEILCRFFVELWRDGHVVKKFGPFFARRMFDIVSVTRPEDRWAQYQDTARMAIEQFAATFARNKVG